MLIEQNRPVCVHSFVFKLVCKYSAVTPQSSEQKVENGIQLSFKNVYVVPYSHISGVMC